MRGDPTRSICDSLNSTALLFISDIAYNKREVAGITCQIFLTNILDRLRSVLNKSTVIFWRDLCGSNKRKTALYDKLDTKFIY